jgi:hypothetical protein
MSTGKWYNVTFVRSGGFSRVYLDGIESSTPAYSDAGAFAIDMIGDRSDHTIPFNGSIDDFRVYNRALSKREISDLYRFNPFGDGGTMSGVLILDGNATALLNVRGAISGASLKITGTGNATFSASVRSSSHSHERVIIKIKSYQPSKRW